MEPDNIVLPPKLIIVCADEETVPFGILTPPPPPAPNPLDAADADICCDDEITFSVFNLVLIPLI